MSEAVECVFNHATYTLPGLNNIADSTFEFLLFINCNFNFN